MSTTTEYVGRHRDTTGAGRRRAQLREQMAMMLGRYDHTTGRHVAC